MPNTRNPSEAQTPNTGRRPDQSQETGRKRHGNQSQEPEEHIESGDTPSRGRQGLSSGQGETGEDEGLSGDAGDGERH